MTNAKMIFDVASSASLQLEELTLKSHLLRSDTSTLELAASWVGNRRKEATGYPFSPQTSWSPF